MDLCPTEVTKPSNTCPVYSHSFSRCLFWELLCMRYRRDFFRFPPLAPLPLARSRPWAHLLPVWPTCPVAGSCPGRLMRSHLGNCQKGQWLGPGKRKHFASGNCWTVIKRPPGKSGGKWELPYHSSQCSKQHFWCLQAPRFLRSCSHGLLISQYKWY